MKRIMCFLIVFVMLISNLSNNSIIANAEDNYYAQYSGSTQASWGYNPNCTFTINKIVNGRFSGRFAASNLGSYNFDEAISGTVYTSGDTFTCVFTVHFYNNNYYSNMLITVHPFDGYCDCFCVGSWHMEDFTMYGTSFYFEGDYGITGSDYFDVNDMKMCMDLSNEIYNIKSNNCENSTTNLLRDKYHCNFSEKIVKNFHNGIKEDAPLVLASREKTNCVDIIAVIRGTDEDEWQGNTELTGTSYNPNQTTHYNFEKGKDSIKAAIELYYRDIVARTNKNINLIITGHSRGAAVANLYAKDATDAMGTTLDMGTPRFNKVTAYTFACPNVAKYESSMDSYSNIFNFCLKEDLVPTVPMTPPANGWNYWRYGLTYYCSLSTYDTSFIDDKDFELKQNTVRDIHTWLKPWRSVNMYYNLPIYGGGTSITSLYNVAHDATGLLLSKSVPRRVVGATNIIRRFGGYGALAPLITTAIVNKDSIASAHEASTYNYVVSKFGDSAFYYYSYNQCIIDNYGYSAHINRNHSSDSRSNRDSIIYNVNESAELLDLYRYSNNTDLLDWDVTDQSTWTGIIWNSSGHVTSIDLSYLDLEGTLDLSDFTAIESVNLAGNKLTSIVLTDCDTLINLNVSANNLTSLDVSDCTDLEALDCSFNDLSNGGLDVSANTALTSLTCDDCGLTTLTVSTLTDLEELSCAFNNLTNLDIEYNTALTSLTCCYNFLDIHKESDLYGDFDELMFSDVYVNYYPQSVPDNATFITNELNALKTFALAENNNDALDWLDENDNIDTDKLQNNVLFEYDGSNYRVVAVDIADAEVEGALNLTALTKLKELYCENTGVTSLNVNGCTVLNTLSCDNCEITSLTLPSNAGAKNTPLYDVSCEYNYIDTTIFTSDMVTYITFKAGATLEYANQKYEDSSALEAALEFAGTLRSSDYSEESFSALSDLVEEYSDFENMLLTQDDVDEMTAEILTAISDLVPYLKLRTVYENGTVSITKDGQPVSTKYTSALSGTPITLTATPEEGYIFNGWYELTAKRIFSTSSTYSFNLTTNLSFEAQFVPTGSATLTFTNDTGQIVDTVTKTAQEWANTSSLTDLLPEVPYKLGHTGGQWSYVESDILYALASGTDSYISPSYNTSSFVYPEIPTPVNNKPVSNLTFSYNETEDIGSFIMAAGIPQELDVEAIGVAFYKGKKETFNPDSYILNINNKSLVSRFDGRESDGLYIVNVHSFSVKNNWCARGFITYREGNELKTHYTNQINVTNTTQNGLRRIIPRSIIFEDSEGGIDMDYDGEEL